MEDKYEVIVKENLKKDGLYIFKLLVKYENDEKEYEIHAFRKDILLKEEELTQEKLQEFAVTEMKDWIKRSGNLPKEKFLQLANGGKIPKDSIEEDKLIKKEVSDLVRTNVTIFAPLFEWAKAKAQKENTSFSDLVSRGLLTLKDSDKEIDVWFKTQGAYVRNKLKGFGSLEIFHYLPNNYKEFDFTTLKNALQNSELRRTGWPIGAYLTGDEIKPYIQEDGIKAEYTQSEYLIFDYWYAKSKGEFYFSRNLESDSGNGRAEPKTSLYFDTTIWRVAEAFEHCLEYYKSLNISNSERVKIKISLYGIQNRKLSAWNPMRAFTLSHYVCGSDKSSWESEMTLLELNQKLDEIIYEASKKLLVMFDFFVPNKEVVQSILDKDYRKSQM